MTHIIIIYILYIRTVNIVLGRIMKVYNDLLTLLKPVSHLLANNCESNPSS